MSQTHFCTCIVGYRGSKTSKTKDEELAGELSPSVMQSGDDSVFVPAVYDEACVLAAGLCRDYVCYRLKRSGYEQQVHVTQIEPASDQALSNRILNLGCDLEKHYPVVYTSVFTHIVKRRFSEASLQRLYFRLGTHILGGHPQSFTWGRLLSLFCVAGELAVDCVAQGNSELVECVIRTASDYMKHTVIEWVVANGGWEMLAEHFTPAQTHRTKICYNFTFVPSKYIVSILSTTALMIIGFIFLRDFNNFFF
uniref:Bcl-2-related ovarian killer protein homolog B n=1 Tax=Phallusia mammillata TaxID=59560 RepID=A0A6F9D7I9_9ASCI|nr:bcl-2-related ovarian killer protein homolog B [Phallusia mammillata]